MVKKIVLFNNKGGVGKTTFLFHLGYTLEGMGKKILFVDLDPQCNLSSSICDEEQIGKLWKTQNSIYHAVEPLIKGMGDIREIKPYDVPNRNIQLIVGDLHLGRYEELLSTAWVESLAGKEIGFRRTSSIFRIIENISNANDIDYVLIDVGPNLGSLNRCVLLSCDYFIIPIVPDLFSFRGLENIGMTFKKWINVWSNALTRFKDENQTLSFNIQNGRPVFAGYINQHFNIQSEKEIKAFKYWTDRVPQMIEDNLIKKMQEIDAGMVTDTNVDSCKLGDFKNYRSLIPLSQQKRKPIFELDGPEIVGVHKNNVEECGRDFKELAEKIIKNTVKIN